MDRSHLLLPLLFASYPVVALLANNVGEVPITQGLMPWLLSLFGALVLFGLLRLISRSWEKASLLCAMVLVTFFTYGHVYTLVKDWRLFGVLIGRHRFLLPIFFLLLVSGALWIYKTSRELKNVISVLAVIGAIAVLFPLITITDYVIKDVMRETQSHDDDSMIGSSQIERGELPDVYYIILDGYGREDVLRDLYGFDNGPFIEYLRSQGFYVADESRSNYVQTILSLPSSLNLGYLQNLNLNLLPNSRYIGGLSERLQHSVVRATLEQMGYITVAFQTGSWPINIKDAEIFYEPIKLDVTSSDVGISWSTFDILLTETTVLRAWNDLSIVVASAQGRDLRHRSYQAHRDRILSALYRLERMAEVEGPKFVYAHIVCPHPPFVFDRNGEEVSHSVPYAISDGDHYHGSHEDYVEQYVGQVEFLNDRLVTIIDRILAESNTKPIVIIQGDHGPGSHLVWDSPDDTDMRERFSILNAYYLPEQAKEFLYPSISPVNSFRLVFRQVFGIPYDLLSDEHFFSTHAHPFDFIPVTDLLNE